MAEWRGGVSALRAPCSRLPCRVLEFCLSICAGFFFVFGLDTHIAYLPLCDRAALSRNRGTAMQAVAATDTLIIIWPLVEHLSCGVLVTKQWPAPLPSKPKETMKHGSKPLFVDRQRGGCKLFQR